MIRVIAMKELKDLLSFIAITQTIQLITQKTTHFNVVVQYYLHGTLSNLC